MYASSSNGAVVDIDLEGGALYLDRTIAYPEGGGQPSDIGYIRHDGKTIRFDHVSKEGGRVLLHSDFPSINIDTVVKHHIHEEDRIKLSSISLGDNVSIFIDKERRALLSLSHTASHVLFMAVKKVRAELIDNIIGCSIRLDSARFDFITEDRVDPEEIAKMEHLCNEFIRSDLPIKLYSLSDYNDAWYWECEGVIIPCGGTHIMTTGPIGKGGIVT